ncbi:hypothetical protein CP973_39280 [Streptomyces albofaciens JCM 4342]|uniref:hypothetical protein n=1 Tax=Streptomyces albofaciens TaxID=66866 RepID=UPI00123B6542|nr:hypothetical protein [Streptomyces albofaciens]KAA6215045.1 hypothetical protein CP973_39280 [Streptomyces albofaciens JCM 4342]
MAVYASYGIDITMNDETVNALSQGGYKLYGFRAVKSTTANGRPLTWFKTSNYAKKTEITWEKVFGAFTSKSTIIDGGKIEASNSYPIDLGQKLVVEEPTGTGHVEKEGTAGAISIVNRTTTRFTSGIAQESRVGGATTLNPLCAFPLYGNNLNMFVPVEKVLLLFASTPIDTGVVIERSFGPGILVDLTEAESRSVTYHIDEGWGPADALWATLIRPDDNIVGWLIEPSQELSLAAAREVRER